jgi:hypothetical protein
MVLTDENKDSTDRDESIRYFEFEIKGINKMPGTESFDLNNLVLLNIKEVT